MRHQRDVFITELFKSAQKNKDIFLLSADFGAPALDAYREQLPQQFIHCGISEQNMVDLAAGLALDGRQVFCYAMAPFISLRCIEQHKCGAGMMNLPVRTIVAGVGLGYADAGPTHYATEDLACLRAIINSTVLTASDPEVARCIAIDSINRPRFSFIRLDRHPSEDIAPGATLDDITRGYRVLRDGRRLAIVSHGFMVANVLDALKQNGAIGDVAVIDLIQAKPVPDGLVDVLAKCAEVVTVEEQTPCGGLGGAVLEAMADAGLVKPVHRITLPERYFFENGGRARLHEIAKLSPKSLAERLGALASH
jgi:transketolase